MKRFQKISLVFLAISFITALIIYFLINQTGGDVSMTKVALKISLYWFIITIVVLYTIYFIYSLLTMDYKTINLKKLIPIKFKEANIIKSILKVIVIFLVLIIFLLIIGLIISKIWDVDLKAQFIIPLIKISNN